MAEILQQGGYNIYQARLYTITDELQFKNTFVDKNEALKFLFNHIQDEHYGTLYARGSIRSIDPVLNEWIIITCFQNNDAVIFDEEHAAIDRWRVNYYDMSDFLMKTEIFEEAVSVKSLELKMIVLNAFYCVVSCQECGSSRFIISQFHQNKAFNLKVYIDKDPAELMKSDIPAEKRFKDLIEKDYAETQRINAERKTKPGM